MIRKARSSPTGIFRFAGLLAGVVLLVAFALFLNALFASRTSQTVSQPQQPESQSLSPTATTAVKPQAITSQQPPATTDHHICSDRETYRNLQAALKEPDKACSLDLSNKRLTELPPQVLELTNLTALFLNYNELTQLPTDIAKLTNLMLLDLTGNPMTTEEVSRIRHLLPKTNVLFLQPMSPP